MQKCNWCSKSFEDGPYSNYCSKKCESQAVANGEVKGVGYRKGCSGVLIIIVIVIIYIFNYKNNDKDTIKSNKTTETNESTKSGDNLESSEENTSNGNDSINEVELNKEYTTVNDSLNQESLQQTSSIEDLAIRLLNEGKSINDVSDSTGLSRSEIRKIKKKVLSD
jgi:hypothetical protein